VGYLEDTSGPFQLPARSLRWELARQRLADNGPTSERRLTQKSEHFLGIRPIYHQLEHRADAHVLIAFLAYCLQVTLKNRLMIHAPGLTPLSVFEKLSTIQMVEVWIPMLDGRNLVLPRHTQPEPDVQALMEQVRITLPPQPPPRIKSSQLPGLATSQSSLLEGTAI
jgi:hypothetical protein